MARRNAGGGGLISIVGITPIFRPVPAPTTTIAELTFDMPIGFGANVLYAIERIQLINETGLTWTVPAAADADTDEVAREEYALSINQGETTMMEFRERGCFYKHINEWQVMKSAAGGGVPTFRTLQLGHPFIFVPFPIPIVIATPRVSLYTILTGDNTPVGGAGRLEMLVRPMKVNADDILSLTRGGEGFI